ncbi:hypothetical protein PHJA_002374900 [Phtheirospermum japonicum]|uniref:Uncharacterized protein n=1 Tax=Phtheirospermum japonicum TaxID=374723 RepID=A0A830CXK2_9LAMI|nr:hypothetical protein PHJA_002374900 [Phtheirospermum japonicum]
MSLRYMSWVAYMRATQGTKDQVSSKCDSTLSRQGRKLSGDIESKAATMDHNKSKLAEESLRTVMYLSCWGPN